MAITLPEAFVNKMKQLLGEQQYEDFAASYEQQRQQGLRINTLKIQPQEFARLAGLEQQLAPIPWTDSGYYYEQELRPGKHPHYHAGLYYIQEPSAMAPAELLQVLPGHKVLDLCAAPGGKSTQLAAKLQGQGVLVANDNARERVKALTKNIELAGVRNCVVLNEEPQRLVPVFEGYFDRILVDAPCSGEGMFRKDETMIAMWQRHSVEQCALMQRDILQHAVRMLAPGGRLVYSTCTFSPEENESQIAALLLAHPELSVEAVPLAYGWKAGRPEWARELRAADGLQSGHVLEAGGGETGSKQADSKFEFREWNRDDVGRSGQQSGESSVHGELNRERSRQERIDSVAGTVRLWPHFVRGEGHYAAVLVKSADPQFKLRHEELTGSASERRKGNEKHRARQENVRRDSVLHTEAHRSIRGGKGAKNGREQAHPAVAPEESWLRFAQANMLGGIQWQGRLLSYGSRVYLQPAGVPSLDGLQVVRPGWYVGEAGTYRFAPSQPLAMGLRQQEALRCLLLSAEEELTRRYLKGETLQVPEQRIRIQSNSPTETGRGEDDHSKADSAKGYVLVCIDGFPVGWGQWNQGMLKNELASGWRLV